MTEQPVKARILKLENNPHTIDFLGDAIKARGYSVDRVRSCQEALAAIDRALPDLVLVVDNLAKGIDARYWMELQHTHPDPRVAMIPLILLVEAEHLEDFQGQAIPGRVVILRLPVNLRRLDETLRALLWPWGAG